MSETENPNPTDESGTGIEGQKADDGTLLGGGESQVDDLSALFTPEEVAAKKETAASLKAEEERRAGLTDEERAAEDEEKEKSSKWDAPAPEKYKDFTLPDGHEADKEIVADFIPEFQRLGLSQEKAQALIDMYHEKIVPKNMEHATAMWDGLKSQWETEAKADKEYGGEKFEENFHFAKKAMDQFATPELRTVMSEYGFGNHPEVIRLMVRIGKTMSDDSTLPGKSQLGAEKRNTLNYDKTK